MEDICRCGRLITKKTSWTDLNPAEGGMQHVNDFGKLEDALTLNGLIHLCVIDLVRLSRDS
ncbi:hypothetical protein DH2020_033747 [Rehmannia glutinosa]|uniref:Uncharacterized protein n=1 Tax=Rehmannia glutinosa TaxID=99300 RepID=A0ABR0VBY6_REHGL